MREATSARGGPEYPSQPDVARGESLNEGSEHSDEELANEPPPIEKKKEVNNDLNKRAWMDIKPFKKELWTQDQKEMSLLISSEDVLSGAFFLLTLAHESDKTIPTSYIQ